LAASRSVWWYLSTFLFTILSHLTFFKNIKKIIVLQDINFGDHSVFTLSLVNSLMVRIVAQAFRRGGPVSIPSSLHRICGERSDKGTVLFQNTTAFPCKYHSFNTPLPFTRLSPTLHNLWQWVHLSKARVKIPPPAID